jgi:hypothetical protein
MQIIIIVKKIEEEIHNEVRRIVERQPMKKRQQVQYLFFCCKIIFRKG